MADGLVDNHSLLGIHLLGNEGTVNAAGFVNSMDDCLNQDVSRWMCFTRVSSSGKFGTVKRKLKAVSNCWICEGWSLVDFKFKPPQNIDEATVPVNLHLSHDNYQPELLANEAPEGSFE